MEICDLFPSSIHNQHDGSQKPTRDGQDIDPTPTDEGDSDSHQDKSHKCKPGQVRRFADHQIFAWKFLVLSEPDHIQLLMSPNCSCCRDVDPGLGLRSYHFRKQPKPSVARNLTGCVQQYEVRCDCAPMSANKKKRPLPILARLMTTTLHIVSGKADVRESFSSEIFAPIKRRGFHFETVYAPLWLAGRALMRWQLDAPLKRTRLRSRVQGDMGQRMRADLGGLGVQEVGGERGAKGVGRGEGLYLRGGQR